MRSRDKDRWNPYIGLVKSKSGEEDEERDRWQAYVEERTQSKDKSLSKSWSNINSLVKGISRRQTKRDTFIKIVD